MSIAKALLVWFIEASVGFGQKENVIFDGSCQDDNMQMVQLLTNHFTSDEHTGTVASMKGWSSSRDLATVYPAQNATISEMQITIFSAVPVFGSDDNYIALLTEKDGDIWQHPRSWQHSKDDQYWWEHGNLDRQLYFCTGPNQSHLAQIVFRGSVLMCPWPPEESDHKMFEVFLEDASGNRLARVVASHEPTLLQQQHFQIMACVRDIFDEAPSHYWQGIFSGVFKQLVEWMEWSLMHGVEHFMVYTFDGTADYVKDIYQKYLDAGVATRVHFNSYPRDSLIRHGYSSNDCLYRAKNRARWLIANIDVDEYLVPFVPSRQGGPHITLSNVWDELLLRQGNSSEKVHSLGVHKIRFARSRPDQLELESVFRETSIHNRERGPKQIIRVDLAYRLAIHAVTIWEEATQNLKVDPKMILIHHYRIPDVLRVDYWDFDFVDKDATVRDDVLLADVPALQIAIQTRFGLETPKHVKLFLRELAHRHIQQ